MVLALPLLLMIMAVIVNFGTLACWKVRGLSMARMTVWGNRWPRSNNGNPQPTYWPAPGTTAMTGPTILPGQVDDPRVDQEVARGPTIMNAQVNIELLDPARGLLRSSASLTRTWPMLGKWPPYHLQATTCLLDDQWQYNTPLMGMGSNQTRRIPILYTLPQARRASPTPTSRRSKRSSMPRSSSNWPRSPTTRRSPTGSIAARTAPTISSPCRT